MTRPRPLLLAACALALLVGCDDPAAQGSGALCSTSKSAETRTVVAQRLRFVVPEGPEVSPGFDLDGRVSVKGEDDLSCDQPDYVSPDGTPGVDNQFSQLWNVLVTLAGDAVEGLIQGVINDGTLLLMVQLEGLDDPENDRCVNVSIFKGQGRPDLGTDGFIAPSQTFDVDEDSPYTIARGTVENGVLRAGPFEAVIPIAVFHVVADLRLHGAYLEATVNDDGSIDGIISGGVELDQIVDIAAQAAQNDGTAERLLPQLPFFLNLWSDLAPNEKGDCTQISAVMRIETTPAYLYEDAIDPSL